jgi:transposase
VGPNPTDRAKGGVKRSLLTDGAGIPLSVAVEGANRNDFKMVAETLGSIPVRRPRPAPGARQNLCLDKGYDYDEVRELVDAFRFTAHIRGRGEEAEALRRSARTRARRWVVERTHSWMNRFRRILVRWEKKAASYLAMLHLALGVITWRASGLLG